ncbi:MAG: hypothetical protein HY534_07945 [Chloroflexi bacterium]|nr:hypothetical protein [Chloroflexota bacterium]
MPDLSIQAAAAKVAAVARALAQLGLPDSGGRTEPESSNGAFASFGEMLLQRQQHPLASVPLPIGAPMEPLAPLLASPSAPAPAPLRPPVVPERLQPPPAPELLAAPLSTETSRAEATGPVETGKFGHWELRPATHRPFFWLAEDQLNAYQSQVVQQWKQNPFDRIWVQDVEPSPENNWAGWGAPPPNWVHRDVAGKLTQAALPWPPPGEPPVGWRES